MLASSRKSTLSAKSETDPIRWATVNSTPKYPRLRTATMKTVRRSRSVGLNESLMPGDGRARMRGLLPDRRMRESSLPIELEREGRPDDDGDSGADEHPADSVGDP